MMSKRSTGIARTGLLVAVFLLAQQTVDAQALDSLLERSPFTARERDHLTDAVTEAAEAGVPRDLLVPRIAEGIAKGVPADRILQSVERDRALLERARELLVDAEAGALVRDRSTWARAANLLRADIPEPAVQTLARATAHRVDVFRPASALLASIVDWGLSADDAALLASAAAVSRIEPDQYPVVLDLLIEARASRIPLDEMVERLAAELPEAASSRELRRATLR